MDWHEYDVVKTLFNRVVFELASDPEVFKLVFSRVVAQFKLVVELDKA